MKYFSFLFLLLGLPLLALAQDSGFVPLTNIPAITEVGNAITTPEGLSIFLNNIYRLAIGIAAVVAVLQIMRAGIMYMGGDSVTEKKEAKNLIALSIGGLILVLSPVVVFSIINPEILSLKIGGIKNLETKIKVCEPACSTGQSCISGVCYDNNITGDGTCNLTCTMGHECREGVCEPVEAASCPSNIADGISVPNITAQNCCVAKGCRVTQNLQEGQDVLSSVPICACEQTGTINIAAPMNLVKYMTLANTGVGTDRGPVGNVATLYGQYKAACEAAGKEIKEDYSDRRRCNDTELRWYTGTKASEAYLWCVPTVMSCVAK